MLLVLLSFGGGKCFPVILNQPRHTFCQHPGCQSSRPSLPRRLTDLLRALHISMVTRTESAIVIGYGDSKTAQSTPTKSGLSSLHCRKWLCNKSPVKFLISQTHFQGTCTNFTLNPKHRAQKSFPCLPEKLWSFGIILDAAAYSLSIKITW